MPQPPFFTRLKDRGLVHIEGPDRQKFLQGLITNDIGKLEPGKILYACFLSPQGKFLHDFFIHDTGEAYLLDCEGGERAHDLQDKLSFYRLRADVKMSVEDTHPVYAVFGEAPYADDPRHAEMGKRSFEKPEDIDEASFEEWDRKRIALTVPDGSRDLAVQLSSMDEARMDRLNAVDYEKGCYVGQELTARMHFRGLGKKHLYTVSKTDLGLDADESFPDAFEELHVNGKRIGEMRSSCGDTGLALLKDDAAAEIGVK